MQDRDAWLSSALLALADIGDAAADDTTADNTAADNTAPRTTRAGGTGTSGTETGEADHARLLVARLAELLSPAEVLLAIPATKAEPAVTAGSSELATRLARLEGPHLMATAAAAGLRVHHTLPMRSHGESLGAVRVLGPHDEAPAAADVLLARTLTEVATISILQRRKLRQSHLATRQLQHALDSRVRIEQGKGAVAAWLGVTPDAAFDLLRAYARAHSTKITRIASDVLDGRLPVTALTSRPGAETGGQADGAGVSP